MISARPLFIGLAVSIAVFGSAVHATPPAAIASTTVSTYYYTSTIAGTTYSYTDPALMATVSDVVPGTSTTATTDASTGTVSVSASSTEPSDGGSSTADPGAVLIYFYDVVGTTKTVPIDITYYLTASRTLPPEDDSYSSPGSLARILFYQSMSDGNLDYTSSVFAESGGGFPDSETVTGTYSTEFVTGEAYGRIDLETQGSSEGYSGFSSSSYALADPYIYIDPAFLAENPGVTLEISAGVGNQAPSASSAPEPCAWALMLVGVGAVGAALRGARRSRPALAA